MSWNLDMEAAKRGEKVKTTRMVKGEPRSIEVINHPWLWLALPDQRVQRGHWVPSNGHHNGYWAGLPINGSVQPIAWQLFEAPLHPHHMLPADLAPVPDEHLPILDDCGSGA